MRIAILIALLIPPATLRGEKSKELPVVPILDSYPQVKASIYLDFDGSDKDLPYSGLREHGRDEDPRSWSKEELADIEKLWLLVSEKFRPFEVNVTTDRSRYERAGADSAPRTIVTITPSHKGASWSGSFFGNRKKGGFNRINGNKNIHGLAGTIGHELGHSFGMDHDNSVGIHRIPNCKLVYRPMFSGSAGLTQWSKGEYVPTDYADRQREPLEIISSVKEKGIINNRIGYRPDDHGNQPLTASLLRPGKWVSAGIIERNTDVDVFRFQTKGGAVQINIRPAVLEQATLDVRADLYSSDGKLVQESNPQGDELGASIRLDSKTAAGAFYLHIRGAGQYDPYTNGYSSYGSLGTYNIDAEFRAARNPKDVVHGLKLSKRLTTPRHTGLIQLPADGIYSFYSDVPGRCSLGLATIFDHKGEPESLSGTRYLSRGLHPITFISYEKKSGKDLTLEFSGPGIKRKRIPNRILFPFVKTGFVPIAKDDEYTVVNSELKVQADSGVLFNDYDYNGEPLKASLVDDVVQHRSSGLQAGDHRSSGLQAGVAHGNLTLNPDGSFVYTPDSSLSGGKIDRFSYRVSDGKNQSKVATVRFRVYGPKINFNEFAIRNYTGTGLLYGALIEDGGNTLRLTASDWSKKILLPCTVTPRTVLAFDFHANTKGYAYHIGFINNTVGVDPLKYFRLAGSVGPRPIIGRFSGLGWIVDYMKGPGSYVIPVGKHFVGPMQSLCFGNVTKKGSKDFSQSTFSNIRVYEADEPSFKFNPSKEPFRMVEPSELTVLRHIEDAFDKSKLKGNVATVSLFGLFTGPEDDWQMAYKVAENTNKKVLTRTALRINNAQRDLSLTLSAKQSGKSTVTLRVTSGKQVLDYKFDVTWKAETSELSITGIQ